MQQKMHHQAGENPGRDIIQYYPGSFRQLFQLPDGRRFHDVEGSEKYKTCEKSFPRERDGNQRDELSGDFVDYHELRIFLVKSLGHPRCCWNTDCYYD